MLAKYSIRPTNITKTVPRRIGYTPSTEVYTACAVKPATAVKLILFDETAREQCTGRVLNYAPITSYNRFAYQRVRTHIKK